MNLYIINDDPHGDLDDQFYAWWAAVWATSEDEALAIAIKTYDGDGDPDDVELDISRYDTSDIPSEYHSTTPGRERRYRVLRYAGWRNEDERTCDTCGLAALGFPEYRVCGECYQCSECGCMCKEDEK